ncbi:hypothetical protein VULLAG_LOCUS11511 [Vulpes lagopus]
MAGQDSVGLPQWPTSAPPKHQKTLGGPRPTDQKQT